MSTYSLLDFCCRATVGGIAEFVVGGGFVCERSMTWTVERLFLWYAQWTAAEWNTTILASEWTREEWAIWWSNELGMAQEETERLWLHDQQNPIVFNDQEADEQCDPRFRSLLISGLESIGE